MRSHTSRFWVSKCCIFTPSCTHRRQLPPFYMQTHSTWDEDGSQKDGLTDVFLEPLYFTHMVEATKSTLKTWCHTNKLFSPHLMVKVWCAVAKLYNRSCCGNQKEWFCVGKMMGMKYWNTIIVCIITELSCNQRKKLYPILVLVLLFDVLRSPPLTLKPPPQLKSG